MFDVEDSRNEFKKQLNDKLEQEVIAFLNADGGNLYIGILDDGSVYGVEDSDKIQLEIKDRLKNNIKPTILGLFDISVITYEDKNIIKITVAKGNQVPYYLRKKGMSPEGCFIRIGSSAESMTNTQIDELYSKRTRTSLVNIVSPIQNLTFSELKIYYNELNYTISDNFLYQLNLIMEDGKYNYLAYLLADNNNIPIQLAVYSGTDSFSLVENNTYGKCCLVKTAKRIVDIINSYNKTFATLDGTAERKELDKFNKEAVREAVINALVHNSWEEENPPVFEIFSDHIAITSTGGLPKGISKKEFLAGYSRPVNPELMRIFKDLNLVEHLGTGIKRILKTYDESVFEISNHFIRVNIPFNTQEDLIGTKQDNKYSDILNIIGGNSNITVTELSDKLGISESTTKRYLNTLKDNGSIEHIGSKKNGTWKIK